MGRLVYEHFGSKKGLVRFLYHWLLAKLGFYSQFTRLKAGDYKRLVFVCSGNICRSPLAEVYARSLGKQAASCGLNCRGGFPADPRAKAFAELHGLNLDGHRTVNVTEFQFLKTDLVIVMEPAHLFSFRRIIGNKHALALAGSYRRKPYPYIHDPFNCCENFFTRCEEEVMESVRGACD